MERSEDHDPDVLMGEDEPKGGQRHEGQPRENEGLSAPQPVRCPTSHRLGEGEDETVEGDHQPYLGCGGDIEPGGGLLCDVEGEEDDEKAIAQRIRHPGEGEDQDFRLGPKEGGDRAEHEVSPFRPPE